MFTSSLILSLAVLPVALGATFEVQVGAGGSAGCSPAEIGEVARGDVVNFVFHPGNHTVFQSSSNTPCGGLSEGGFNTGTVLVSSGTTTKKSFFVPDETTPLFFSCGAASAECQSRTTLTINSTPPPSPKPEFEAFRIQARATSASGFTSLNSATATLGSHNPGTFSGSIATAESVQEGPTGSVTDGLSLSDSAFHPATAPAGASGSSTASASASASSTTGKSSGADSMRIRMPGLILGAVLFLSGVLIV